MNSEKHENNEKVNMQHHDIALFTTRKFCLRNHLYTAALRQQSFRVIEMAETGMPFSCISCFSLTLKEYLVPTCI